MPPIFLTTNLSSSRAARPSREPHTQPPADKWNEDGRRIYTPSIPASQSFSLTLARLQHSKHALLDSRTALTEHLELDSLLAGKQPQWNDHFCVEHVPVSLEAFHSDT